MADTDNYNELTPEMFIKLPDSEKSSEIITMESKTYAREAWDRFRQNKIAVAGLIFMALIIGVAIFGPILSQYSYYGQNIATRNSPPSATHWFGSDVFGRDIFVRVAHGARISLSIGFTAAFINLIIGTIIGGTAGFFGGKLDMVLMRFVDILYSIPVMFYVILILLIFGPSVFSVIVAICISHWVGMARIVRSQVLTLKEQEFALAAQVIGASKKRILFKHLILNSMGPIIATMTLMIPSAIFTEAYLSFLGIGISVPRASWGSLAQEAQHLMDTHPIQIIWPVGAICLTMFALNFIGDSLGDALDPKKRSR